MKRILDYNSFSFTYSILNNQVVNLKGIGYLDLIYLKKNKKKIIYYILSRVEKKNAILSKFSYKNEVEFLAN